MDTELVPEWWQLVRITISKQKALRKSITLIEPISCLRYDNYFHFDMNTSLYLTHQFVFLTHITFMQFKSPGSPIFTVFKSCTSTLHVRALKPGA